MAPPPLLLGADLPISGIKNAGLIHQIKIANKPNFPLEHFTKPNMFIPVPHDIGLLGCLLDLLTQVIIQQDFGMAKGFFTDVYVAQCLAALAPADKEEQLYCWQEGEAEVEFIRSSGNAIFPLRLNQALEPKRAVWVNMFRDIILQLLSRYPQNQCHLIKIGRF